MCIVLLIFNGFLSVKWNENFLSVKRKSHLKDNKVLITSLGNGSYINNIELMFSFLSFGASPHFFTPTNPMFTMKDCQTLIKV